MLARAGLSVGAARGRGDRRRRLPLGRADAAGVRARRVRGGAPAGGGLAVHALGAARAARGGVGALAGGARASLRRRDGGAAPPLGGRDRGGPRRGRGALPAADGSARRARRSAARRAARADPAAPEPGDDGAVLGPGGAAGDRPRAAHVSRRPRHAASSPGSRRTRCCRSPGSRPRHSGSCSGCSRIRSAGRLPAADRSGSRTGSPPTSSRSAGRSRRAGVWTALAELGALRPALFDVSPRSLVEIAGGAFPSGYRRRLERFRYGPGRVQAGLGAGRADSVARGGVRERGDRASGRDARGDRRLRAGAVAGRDLGAALRAARPADALRSRRVRRRGSTRRGPTATSRTGRRWT